jgi:hypothetical protein
MMTDSFIYINNFNKPTVTIIRNKNRVDRDKPWFNSGIKREMKIGDSLHKKMRKQPNINNICKYKVQRNKVNNMIIHAKQHFFLNSNDFLDENSSDSYYHPNLKWNK